ncbi:hypothetical protein [Streptomyces sp. MB09-02B]|uniref:hypothetical protein n=1 Tax=Streptomyces sp. MB09-02B TaxID=3028667 RepID=UPI0029AA5B89|nr:hypothetical protein [Streptomyces sp. MB09-02B]MDX3638438.1 hypothetical protein [Streptomyces sp. MB09-02B]
MTAFSQDSSARRPLGADERSGESPEERRAAVDLYLAERPELAAFAGNILRWPALESAAVDMLLGFRDFEEQGRGEPEKTGPENPAQDPDDSAKSSEAQQRYSARGRHGLSRLAAEIDAELRQPADAQHDAAGDGEAGDRYSTGDPVPPVSVPGQRPAQMDDVIDWISSECTLADAALLRRAAQAVDSALLRIVVDTHIQGRDAKEIARDLGIAVSRVRRLLRDNPWEAYFRIESEEGSRSPLLSGVLKTQDSARAVASAALDEHLGRTGGGGSRLRVSVWRRSSDARYNADTALCVIDYEPVE